jgi:hypothetical protein
MSTKATNVFRARTLNDERVKTQITAAEQAQVKFVDDLKPWMAILYPEHEVETLHQLIARETDPEVIAAASKRITELQGDGPTAARERARIVSHELLDQFRVAVKPLLDTAEAVAGELVTEAENAETELFERYGIKPRRTEVSEAAKRFLADVGNVRIRLTRTTDAMIQQVRVHPRIARELLVFFQN